MINEKRKKCFYNAYKHFHNYLIGTASSYHLENKQKNENSLA